MIPEQTKCAICGKPEKGIYDLRCVRIANNGHYWEGYYRPHLSPEEKWLLKDNKEHYICTDRQGCKNRKIRNENTML